MKSIVKSILHGKKKSEGINPIIELNNEAVGKYRIDRMPLPMRIDIETINRCNGVCTFCPVNANEPQRPYAKMTEELFKKIIDELEKLNYSGSVALFDNNEPFLDERIIEFQRYGKTHVPNAFWDLWTNGSLVTIEKFDAIIPYLDRLYIDNYNNEGMWNPTVQALIDYLEDKPALKEKVVFQMRKQNEVLTSRGDCPKTQMVQNFLPLVVGK